MSRPARRPKVAILLCTYNGRRFLGEQLDSYAAQTYAHWELQVSDDGSKDGTLELLASYQARWGAEKLTLHAGPAKGFAANFLSLICRPGLEADCFAYSDQDDIWQAEKLERAVHWLQSVPEGVPALYCGRTRLVDAGGREIGLSPLFPKPAGFANALMQNIASGNTMVLNSAARALLLEAGKELPVVAHDWWTYIVVTGCGGRVFYDPEPTLLYRQHDANVIGMNSTWGARLDRIRMLWHERFRRWNDCNIAALGRLKHRLIPRNKEILENFAKARKMGFFGRILYFKRSGIYRQTWLGNIGLVIAVIFKKF
ncbi:glycosyltransferase family 2 protein [Comamonas endophytica]|uniref:Glycosyltransferase family 2 protein n=1 Tax=Comamonas endophytica TaxID=2949090 RepID=A0ABY6G653_9BURK|nr:MULTISPECIES: glycosyltransferase family 2 protein [unclassified Acidovorax]MCD2511079.1 glycosyltransferase family 2 protein [Acidovorax sp. D4N7]UYG50484.1 glycosyltransferase family 2 protein [Acidovorax sp. 5MLIR]